MKLNYIPFIYLTLFQEQRLKTSMWRILMWSYNPSNYCSVVDLPLWSKLKYVKENWISYADIHCLRRWVQMTLVITQFFCMDFKFWSDLKPCWKTVFYCPLWWKVASRFQIWPQQLGKVTQQRCHSVSTHPKNHLDISAAKREAQTGCKAACKWLWRQLYLFAIPTC